MLSFFRKSWPVTVMAVVAPPAVGCSPMLAPVGKGRKPSPQPRSLARVLVALTANVYVMLSASPDFE